MVLLKSDLYLIITMNNQKFVWLSLGVVVFVMFVATITPNKSNTTFGNSFLAQTKTYNSTVIPDTASVNPVDLYPISTHDESTNSHDTESNIHAADTATHKISSAVHTASSNNHSGNTIIHNTYSITHSGNTVNHSIASNRHDAFSITHRTSSIHHSRDTLLSAPPLKANSSDEVNTSSASPTPTPTPTPVPPTSTHDESSRAHDTSSNTHYADSSGHNTDSNNHYVGTGSHSSISGLHQSNSQLHEVSSYSHQTGTDSHRINSEIHYVGTNEHYGNSYLHSVGSKISEPSLIPNIAAITTFLNRDLSQGFSGPDVIELQKILIEEGVFSDEATGFFGPKTDTAVRIFQAKYNISPVSGYVGPKTRSLLNTSLDQRKPL